MDDGVFALGAYHARAGRRREGRGRGKGVEGGEEGEVGEEGGGGRAHLNRYKLSFYVSGALAVPLTLVVK